MKVANLLVQDMVLPELESRERDGALREMVSFLKHKNRIGKEKELYERLVQREDLGSTAIGDGVAVPHCKIKSVKDPLIMLAISREGVDFNAPDGNLSHIFFVVASSLENPSLNLQILAAVARLVRKADTLFDRMMESRDAAALVNIVQEEENRINE